MTNPRTVLVVEDDASTRKYMTGRLTKMGHKVLEAPDLAEGRKLVDSHVLDLAYLDLGLGRDDKTGQRGREMFGHIQSVAPDVPVIVVTADESATSAVELLRMGAFHYAVKPIEPEDLEHLTSMGLELSATRRELGVLRDVRLRPGLPTWHVGQTSRMQAIANVVQKFGQSDVGILIQGESGTGKEVVANALHERSGRKGEFVTINCSAIPRDLFESQLFGHEKGAFTGATELQLGLLELADGGTVLLDELTTLPLEMQAKLLRALQEFHIRRVGGSKTIDVDVRVISASNRDVGEAIRAKDFRSDLYYRLCVTTVELPPLRDRTADIPFFVSEFITAAGMKRDVSVEGITDGAMWALVHYDWPGNIRELQNVIDRAMILASGEREIDVVHLPGNVRGIAEPGLGSTNGHRPSLPTNLPEDGIDLKSVRDGWEREMVSQALDRTNGNQSAAARMLSLTRDELRYRVEKLGIGDE